MILFRYLCREIYLTFLVVMLVFISILFINEFSRFLEDAAAGKYPISTAITLVILQLPLIITYLLPLGFFLAIIIAVGRLYTDNEMTVMSACGMSLLWQTVTIMCLACVVAAFSAWLSLWLNPCASTIMKQLRNKVVNAFQVSTLVPNRFEEISTGHVLYALKISHKKDEASDVFFAIRNHPETAATGPQWDIVYAKKMNQTMLPGVPGRFVVLRNGTRYTLAAGANEATMMSFKQYGTVASGDLLFGHSGASGLSSSAKGTMEMSTRDLYGLIRHNVFAAAEWQLRLAVPISILISSLIAIALSEVNPRQVRYINMVWALGVYLSYWALIFLFQSWIKKGVLPAMDMWGLHGVAAILSLLLFMYRIGWQRVRQLMHIG